jgi:hypothetical protein
MAASTVPGPQNATHSFHSALQVCPGTAAVIPTYDPQHISTPPAKPLTAGLNSTVGFRPLSGGFFSGLVSKGGMRHD